MPIIALVVPDEKVEVFIKFWISEAGGVIPLEELQEKFARRFKFYPRFIDDQIIIGRLGANSMLYKLENGLVSEPVAH